MKFRLSLLTIILLACTCVMAQQTGISTTAEHIVWPIDTVNGKAVYKYTVEKSIGLYRVSKNFGVTQEEILTWNPQLRERGLHVDEVILIPVVNQPSTTIQEVKQPQPQPQPQPQSQPSEVKKDTVQTQPVEKQVLTIVQMVHEQRKDSIQPQPFVLGEDAIRLALMLPLQAKATDRDQSMDRFYDFYAGALLAVNDLQQAGQQIEVQVYDIEKSAKRMAMAQQESKLKTADIIIGSAYAPQVTLAAEMAAKDSILTLIPFSSSVPGIDTIPYLLQFNPTSYTEAQQLANYLAEQKEQIHCVLIESPEQDIPESVQQIRHALDEQQIAYATTTIHAILTDSMSAALRDSVENLILFNTERFSNLQAVMPHLLAARTNYRISLLSRYSWQKEKILMPTVYATIFHSDSTSIGETYQQSFDRYFHHSLSSLYPRYDLLGYDLTHHMLQLSIRLRQTSDVAERETILRTPYKGLQSYIQFEHVGENGGWENKAVHIIHQ